jgi:starvation-inducible DNA-binding protein
MFNKIYNFSGQSSPSKHMKNNNLTTQNLSQLLNSLIQSYYIYKDLHWNFEGEDFVQYHKLFDAHATLSIEPQDTIAERIRQLDSLVIADLKVEAKFDFAINQKKLKEILEFLIKMHDSIIKNMENTVKIADENGDYATADIVTKYLQHQQQMQWFIRSSSR